MQRGQGGGGALDGLRVLLVEDVDDIRDLLAFLLRAEGAEVRHVRAALWGVESVSTWRFDLLLIFLGLRDLCGY
jgi:DNA-binding response OmpR family regulator